MTEPTASTPFVPPAPHGDSRVETPAPDGDNRVVPPAPHGDSRAVPPAPDGDSRVVPPDRCPLPDDELSRCLEPFGSSRTLPQAAYTSDAVLAWERTALFDRSWVCIGRSADLDRSGAQKALTIGSTGIVLTRDADGRLHAVVNICRHRGHELLACGASGVRSGLRCPYHGWSFELDGRLRHAPHLGPALDDGRIGRSDLALRTLRVEEWGGWAFLNQSGDAPPLADHLGDLVTHAAPWRGEDLVVVGTHDYELAANWKLVTENYHECYHCPLIHPELCRVTVAGSGDNVRGHRGAFVGGSMVLADGVETMSLDGRSGGRPLPGIASDPARRRQVHYFGLLPNMLLSLHPDYVMTHRAEPLAPDRTRIQCQWLVPADVASDPGFDPAYAIDFWDLTNRQDWAACESVQRSMASPHYEPGVLAHSEDAVYQFTTMLARAYRGEPLAPAALPGDYTRVVSSR